MIEFQLLHYKLQIFGKEPMHTLKPGPRLIKQPQILSRHSFLIDKPNNQMKNKAPLPLLIQRLTRNPQRISIKHNKQSHHKSTALINYNQYNSKLQIPKLQI